MDRSVAHERDLLRTRWTSCATAGGALVLAENNGTVTAGHPGT